MGCDSVSGMVTELSKAPRSRSLARACCAAVLVLPAVVAVLLRVSRCPAVLCRRASLRSSVCRRRLSSALLSSAHAPQRRAHPRHPTHSEQTTRTHAHAHTNKGTRTSLEHRTTQTNQHTRTRSTNGGSQRIGCGSGTHRRGCCSRSCPCLCSHSRCVWSGCCVSGSSAAATAGHGIPADSSSARFACDRSPICGGCDELDRRACGGCRHRSTVLYQ